MVVVVGSGYQHSLSEMRAKVRRRLAQSDASNSNWEDADLDDFLNDGIKMMLLDGIGIEIAQDTFTTTEDQQTWTPPDTVWKTTACAR